MFSEQKAARLELTALHGDGPELFRPLGHSGFLRKKYGKLFSRKQKQSYGLLTNDEV